MITGSTTGGSVPFTLSEGYASTAAFPPPSTSYSPTARSSPPPPSSFYSSTPLHAVLPPGRQEGSRNHNRHVEIVPALDLQALLKPDVKAVRKVAPQPADRLLAKEWMRPPKYGGHSKRDQLGSVTESWGPLPTGVVRVGLFQHEPEAPSPTGSPIPVDEVPIGHASRGNHWEITKEEALARARAGTSFDAWSSTSTWNLDDDN